MRDLNNRIQQLTKLILTSATVDEGKGDESRPASPVKVDFDMSPYQVSLLPFCYPIKISNPVVILATARTACSASPA